MTNVYDVIVIGAGPVGENVADRIVRGGLTAAIVERELVGGECSYWACMPTKALLRDAAALRAARALPAARAAITGPLDTAEVFARRNRFASQWKDAGQVDWLHSAGIDLVRGHGRLSGPRRVHVRGDDGGEVELRARHAVVVATGSSALRPAIPGLDQIPTWTSREAASADSAPERLAIIGGGVVGTELATAYSALGSGVTLVSRTRLLPGVEEFASEHVTAALEEAGVTTRTGVDAVAARCGRTGAALLELSDGTTVEADRVLLAVGRAPNTGDIGLDTVGLTPGAWLTVGQDLRVLADDGAQLDDGWLYAAGDVNRRAQLTHHGKYQARALGDAVAARAAGEDADTSPWGRHASTADEHATAQVIFTAPEIATVGHTAASAEAHGLSTRVVDHDLGAVAGAALHADGYTGRARMVIDNDRNVVVGFTAVGFDVAEILHAATIAITGEVPLDRLWHAVPAFPTISEVWLRLLETDGRDH
ncbi:dihydrolipoyl dehydrogenase family protein [Marinitenerispora sediminis]|uniref:Pyridine nucleotide-disulfide oxidoreductase n=1 Tax=Marinitenerispora sediminis TaxID=1931232 RepID=A0A368T4R8_9ACTN|nr:NAD(P)/FAD-dependent oxidoreductase [Marinitenerispora sediminis]RCV50301.1 pyridine nucleotide-disulfide oxidoreductase [Marinitenerispora sediminis]RCV53764.1 pyridine nucleotide-disulfide oxidoreductase [Marinitenerispora sediminis]RCV58053.1 pyridine nucleotide-disulfide oxidoreductase [Marinitenerispora sediminis]